MDKVLSIKKLVYLQDGRSVGYLERNGKLCIVCGEEPASKTWLLKRTDLFYECELILKKNSGNIECNFIYNFISDLGNHKGETEGVRIVKSNGFNIPKLDTSRKARKVQTDVLKSYLEGLILEKDE